MLGRRLRRPERGCGAARAHRCAAVRGAAADSHGAYCRHAAHVWLLKPSTGATREPSRWQSKTDASACGLMLLWRGVCGFVFGQCAFATCIAAYTVCSSF